MDNKHFTSEQIEVIERYQRQGIQASWNEFDLMLETLQTPLEMHGEIITVEAEEDNGKPRLRCGS